MSLFIDRSVRQTTALRLALALLALAPAPVIAQRGPTARALLPIEQVNSAEFGWLAKPVLASRVLDDMTQMGV